MAVRISLREMLATGRFGPVTLGMHRDEVEHVLGRPDTVGGTSRKHREPLIWKYGTFEIHFDLGRHEVSLVYADNFRVLEGGTQLEIDSWALSGESTREAVEDALQRESIVFAPTLYPWTDRAGELVTDGLVTLLFQAPEGTASTGPSTEKLWAISLSSSCRVVVAESIDRHKARRQSDAWIATHPELARHVSQSSIEVERIEDGNNLFRILLHLRAAEGSNHHP
ncbi:MAG: hypothetical protein HY901_02750 [Deltaproteobacteria bacterium]|nr:hypothetical protein [Deltaproteobacteria bacterium]